MSPIAGGHDTMADPQLPPELWNLAVVVTVFVLLGWMMRLLRLMITAADVRHAIASNAVLHLGDLGASLHVLHNASMWHLHQLLRTSVEATATKMPRVQMLFDIVASSVDIKRAPESSGSSVFSFSVQSAAPCAVQVFWDVDCASLDTLAFSSGFAPLMRSLSGASIASPRQILPPVLRQISVDGVARTLRAAPSRLGSEIRRQRRRHELRDDSATECSTGVQESGDGARAAQSFTSESDVIKCDPPEKLVTVIVPSCATASPSSELQSLMDEVDSHSPASLPALSAAASTSAPRFSAVIVIRPAQALDSLRTSVLRKFSVKASAAGEPAAVVCHCVAIDFLPTPLKPERFTPAVVKRISYTKSAAYVSQEIFGRDVAAGSECAICLEGAVSVVLLPCRHFCVCRVCLEEIDRCPICRAAFATYVCYEPDAVNDDGRQLQDRI